MVNMIPSLIGKSCEEKLAKINIMSLAACRTRADLISTFEIIKGVDNMNHVRALVRAVWQCIQADLSSYPMNIIAKPAGEDVRKNFFLT